MLDTETGQVWERIDGLDTTEPDMYDRLVSLRRPDYFAGEAKLTAGC